MKFRVPNFEKEDPELFIWYDAATHTRKNKEKLKLAKDTREFLGITKTIGYKIAEDKYAVIIATEICDDEVDITVIPKKWLVK